MSKKFLLVVVLVAFGLVIGCGGEKEETTDQSQAENAVETKLVKDAVCGMNVDPATSTIKAEYESKSYYFCSEGCKEKFEANPAEFAVAEAAEHDHGEGADHVH